tara:strand:+ start:56 stop:283 length:228 start_codon:yes stop_codon:yes gene_type:complete
MNILNKRNYGDFDNIKDDVKTLHNIINRQGTVLVTDCIAESIGQASIKFNLSFNESKNGLNSILKELKEQTLERI